MNPAVVDPAGAALGELEAVTLEELTTRGSLMTRTDRKYVVPTPSLPMLVRRLAALDPEARVLDINGRRTHGYASTYLDTPELDCYWMAARRRRRRFKVRRRAYVDTGLAFTEVKTRAPRGRTVKVRVPLPGHAAEVGLLHQAHIDFVGTELAKAGLPHVAVPSLVPTLHTTYVRSTLWLPGSGARVTIDQDLMWSLPWEPTARAVRDLAVVETKSSRAGTGVDRALWRAGHRPVRISKYGTGLGLLMPHLPANRWHRVLMRLQVAAPPPTQP